MAVSGRVRKVIGLHACLEVLKIRPRKVRAVYIQTNWKQRLDLKNIVEQARRFRIDFFEQTKSQLSSWGAGHQGAALIVEESPRLQEKPPQGKSIFIFIDGLEDPRNLGAVLRSAWLMGAGAVFLPVKDSIRRMTAVVSKSASGGAEHIPVEFLNRPCQWIRKIKKQGYFVYGLDKKGPRSLWKEKMEGKIVLAVGSEGRGLKNKTKQLCDVLLSIPQVDSSGSYNLSVAVALALSQINRVSKK